MWSALQSGKLFRSKQRYDPNRTAQRMDEYSYEYHQSGLLQTYIWIRSIQPIAWPAQPDRVYSIPIPYLKIFFVERFLTKNLRPRTNSCCTQALFSKMEVTCCEHLLLKKVSFLNDGYFFRYITRTSISSSNAENHGVCTGVSWEVSLSDQSIFKHFSK